MIITIFFIFFHLSLEKSFKKNSPSFLSFFPPLCFPHQVCAYLDWNLDGLVEMIWEYLSLTRVYTKPKGKLPDWNEPVVLAKKEPTV